MNVFEKLSVEFEKRFQYFKSHIMISFWIIKNLFQSDENEVQETVLHELIDLKKK